jgi:hypothetical protein
MTEQEFRDKARHGHLKNSTRYGVVGISLFDPVGGFQATEIVLIHFPGMSRRAGEVGAKR